MAEPFEATPTNDVLDENRVFFRADFTDPRNLFPRRAGTLPLEMESFIDASAVHSDAR